MANRLAAEKSPYLLQHAENPVDWYPWGDEAFARARAEDKPIFLSVGYSTCHWCHVMERESFEDASIAQVLNRDFVPVKVDREERPDVDRVYMTFVQVTTGAGGWPMSVWLTPDLKPFFGGTYFPPDNRFNRPGFMEVLRAVSRAWTTERQRIEQSAASVIASLREAATAAPGGGTIAGAEALAAGVAAFAQQFDRRHGGFGSAPKFPRPSELLFLLREHARTGEALPRDLALQTLQAMALGGMRDHIGGGFHRYSVDAEWRVPHFEKMLYDQAQLAIAYLEAAQASGSRFYAEVAEDTLRYVAREMTHPDGGFYSAEDADSVPPEEAEGNAAAHAHKIEGAFYTWRAQELRERLGDDYAIVALRYGVQDDGNAPFDPQGEFTGKNLLYTARTLDAIAAETGRTAEDVAEALDRARLALFGARLERPRPHLDDKILAAWNGLMIGAFARAARVLRAGAPGLPEASRGHVETAERAARFIQRTLWDARRGVLLRRFRDGDAGIDGYAEDYAAMTWGLLELFQSTGNPEWLQWADTLQQRMDERFYDSAEGAWFSTAGDDPTVLVRHKEDYDGAEPSATAMALVNLQVLTHLRDDAARRGRIEQTLTRFGPRLGEYARAVPMVMTALSAWHAGIGQAVIAGDPDGDAAPLHAALAAHHRPFLVTVPLRDAWRPALAEALPFVASMEKRGGKATAYVCENFTCQAPVTEVEELERILGARAS